MRIVQKSLLFASVLALGTSATTLATTLTSVDAITVPTGLTYLEYPATATIKITSAHVYNQNGQITGRGLSLGTSWKIDRQANFNGVAYYRVATNQFVKATDVNVLMQTPGIAENNSQSMGQIMLHNRALIITAPKAQLYDMNGNKLSRALTQGTSWKIGIQNNIGSGTYYSVSNTEYVKASDAYVYQTSFYQPFHKQVITITTNYPAPIVDHNGKVKQGRALAPQTSWVADERVTINHQVCYRVGNDEFVSFFYTNNYSS